MIQDKDDSFYMQFGMVVCGLDSIEARRWINSQLVELFDEENPDSLKPLIDGGTEGKFKILSTEHSFLKFPRLQGAIQSYNTDYDFLYRVSA